ncbi:MAG TPA: hypothetical protein VNR86_05085, partial [Sphingomicrobium sp.]|nr:hypothetical protein [Sphingomicrobium sp.]
MASQASLDRRNSTIPDIESLAQPTLAERGRQRFCSALRRYAIQDMSELTRSDFEMRVKPAAEARGERLDSAKSIEAAMHSEPSYQLYSSLRYNAQEMCFLSVQDSVERALPEMIKVARDAVERSPSGGSLRLAPDLEIPRYVSALDVHLTPGCFHSEWVEDDVAQGAVVSLGSRVFTASMNFRSWGGVARVISRWVKHVRPDFRPLRILDLG